MGPLTVLVISNKPNTSSVKITLASTVLLWRTAVEAAAGQTAAVSERTAAAVLDQIVAVVEKTVAADERAVAETAAAAVEIAAVGAGRLVAAEESFGSVTAADQNLAAAAAGS